MLNCDDCYICYRWWLKQNDMRPNVKVKVAQPNLEHRRQPLQCNAHYNLSLISFILVWPLWVRIPESLPTKVVNCVVLCIVCVDCVVLCIVCVQMCTVLLPPSVNPIAVNNIYIVNKLNAESLSKKFVYLLRYKVRLWLNRFSQNSNLYHFLLGQLV